MCAHFPRERWVAEGGEGGIRRYVPIVVATDSYQYTSHRAPRGSARTFVSRLAKFVAEALALQVLRISQIQRRQSRRHVLRARVKSALSRGPVGPYKTARIGSDPLAGCLPNSKRPAVTGVWQQGPPTLRTILTMFTTWFLIRSVRRLIFLEVAPCRWLHIR